MRWWYLLVLLVFAGCGTFTCDCGDGRKFEQTFTPSGTDSYNSCALFCTKTEKKEPEPTCITTTPGTSLWGQNLQPNDVIIPHEGGPIPPLGSTSSED